jgi:transposase
VSQKSGLNRAILAMGWGMFAARLEYKMGGRVEYVPAEYTSQRCSDCKYVDRENRESQAVFLCLSCGYSCNADVNAARNIAAGLAVYSAVRLLGNVSTPMKREPLNTANSCL